MDNPEKLQCTCMYPPSVPWPVLTAMDTCKNVENILQQIVWSYTAILCVAQLHSMTSWHFNNVTVVLLDQTSYRFL